MLSVQVGGHPYLIDVISIREIRGWSPSAPLPGGPAYVEGVCDLRGKVIPVISMVARLGLDRSLVAPTVTVVIEVGGRLVGIAVDSVCDLVSLPSDRLQPTPAAGGPAARELLSAVVELDGRVFGLIDFSRLTPFDSAAGEPTADLPRRRTTDDASR
jgi:purine-binding chemotaxis protein CheW